MMMRSSRDRAWTALGLMSGTSADGITATIIRLSARTIKLVAVRTFPYSKTFRAELLAVQTLPSSAVQSFNIRLGEKLARAALSVIKHAQLNPKHIEVIGSHGHTVEHRPRSTPPWSYQIGESSIIAERTGITTVADFRARDMAVGGEGAPLVPFLDQFLFGSGQSCAVQNIGGIANVTLVGRKHARLLAFDTGPGNGLLDLAMTEISRGRHLYDRNGRLAAQGHADHKLIRRMLAHAYFRRQPPKSTGREEFNWNFLPTPLKRMIRSRPADAMATLNLFIAMSIYRSYKMFIFPRGTLKRIMVSGGGVYNRTLMENLGNLFYPTPVESSEQHGIHPLAKESMAFTLMAIETIRGRSNHVPSATGARHPVILGKITPGKNFKEVRIR